MKKILILFMVFLMTISIVACGDKNTAEEDSQNQSIEESNELTIGDTIKSGGFEITLTRAEFTDEINTTPTNADFMFPLAEDDNTSTSIKTSSFGDDQIFLTFALEYKFIGKSNMEYNNHLMPYVTYNKDYVFFENCVVARYNAFMETWDILGQNKYNPMADVLGNYIPTTEYEALDSTTYEARGIIRVPKELAENTDNPLILSFSPNETQFNIR